MSERYRRGKDLSIAPVWRSYLKGVGKRKRHGTEQSEMRLINTVTVRSTPQMMQVTRAAFQAIASLNEQATDPKSHTLVRILFTGFS